jgi:dipicolinate synthase subunit B
MVPFRQDDPVKKPNSLVADMEKIFDAALMALKKTQIQPIMIGEKGL